VRGVLFVGLVTAALGCGRFGFDARPADGGGIDDDGSPDALGDGTVPIATCARTQPSGMVIHVATTGSDTNPGTATQPVRTISHGLLLLPPAGGTVLVAAGVYLTEPNGEVNTDLSDVRILSETPYGAQIPRFECFDCHRVLLEGFEVTGGAVCTQITSGVDMTFRDNVIHKCTSAAMRIAGSVVRAVATSNVIYDSRNALVHVNDDSQADVVDNVLFDTTVQGDFPMVWLEGTINTRFARNVVFDGHHPITAYGAISIGTATNLMIENNIVGPNAAAFTNAGALGLDSALGDATVRYNTFIGPFPGSVFALGRNGGPLGPATIAVTHNLWYSMPQTAQPFSNAADNGADAFSLQRNDYWNGGAVFSETAGKLGPSDDTQMIAVDPGLPGPTAGFIPTWNAGTMSFDNGSATTCDVHAAMVDQLGKLLPASPVVGRGLIAPPATDIRGKTRPTPATLGAYEP
jgi:hypothetical protein